MSHPFLEQFSRLHVIRRLSEVVLSWWQAKIYVRDISGRVIGGGDKPLLEKLLFSVPIKLRDETVGFICAEGEAQKSDRDFMRLQELVQIMAQEIVFFLQTIEISQQELKFLKEKLAEKKSYAQIVGQSQAMLKIYSLIERIKDAQALVLIRGENGTGKELIAKALHSTSKREKEPFCAINCASFNENLLESELFGHAKGAFTGAINDKKGVFEEAGTGTLFLDEIGDMSASMQVKLLRVLQDGSYRRVGGGEEKKLYARVVCATNKDLEKMVEEGSFREDLFYRLNVIHMMLPSLRERKEDIPLLIDFFLEKYAAKTSSVKKKIGHSTYKYLLDYSWPGNIRELENEIERLCILSGMASEISSEDFSPRLLRKKETQNFSEVHTTGNLKKILETVELQAISEGLKRTKFNKSKLAKELGISRANLIAKIAKYNL